MTEMMIDALVEAKAREAQQAVKDQVVRQCLSALDPQPSDYTLPYQQILTRLEEVIARELQSLGDE